MEPFNIAYKNLLNSIEKKYNIELTLAEKLAIKTCLYEAQRAKGTRLTNLVGEFSKKSAECMWLRQYEVYFSYIGDVTPPEKQYDFVRQAREEHLLI